jgi:hypothetical protein
MTVQQLTKVYDIDLTLRPCRHKYPTLLLLFHLFGALRFLLIIPLEPAVRVVQQRSVLRGILGDDVHGRVQSKSLVQDGKGSR